MSFKDFWLGDFRGLIAEKCEPTGSQVSPTTFEYDETSSSPSLGWLKKITDGNGDEVRFESYGSSGNATSISTDPDRTSPSSRVYENYLYDALHRAVSNTHNDSSTFAWNYSDGKLESTEDEAGSSQYFTWCPGCGALDTISGPLNWSIGFTKNEEHLTTSFDDARNNQTVYAYGDAKEPLSTTYSDSSVESYTYKDSGRIASFTNGRSQEMEYTYDSAGRVASISFPTTSETTQTFDWNLDGTLFQMTDDSGTTTYNYNDARQLSSVVYNYWASGLASSQTVEYEYYTDQLLKKITWKDGANTVATWEYSYDAGGRLTSLTSPGATASFGYDGQGKLLSQINSNGTRTDYVYNDNRGWPTSITHKSGGVSFEQFSLTYDGGQNTAGNLTGVTELDGSAVTYGYDALYRLTSEMRTGRAAYLRSNGYDLAGNLTSLNGSTFATYDAANNISSLTGGTVSNDADGNLTSLVATGIPQGTFTWNTESKLTSQASPLVTTSYGYNAFGQRVWSQTGDGPKRFYIFAGSDLIGEISDSMPAMAYTWAQGKLISQHNLCSGRVLWYHFGPQGEARYLTNSSGAMADSYNYTGYGVPVVSSGNDYNPFRYGGRFGYYSDGTQGLILAGQRWYRPYVARWLSRDPIRFSGGWNLFAYVTNNPVKYLDPSGLALFNNSPYSVWVKPENARPILVGPWGNYPGSIDGVKPPAFGGKYWYKVSGEKEGDAPDVIIDCNGIPTPIGGHGIGTHLREMPDIPFVTDWLPGWKLDPAWSNRHPDWIPKYPPHYKGTL